MKNPVSEKITSAHLDRLAYIYIRQSSPRQVEEHLESKYRQYQLVDRVKEMGWDDSKIIIIDSDQGMSGAQPGSRKGFEEVIVGVGAGKAGIVVALEASRLARNSPDWQNLLFMSRYTHTLIADENAVYDVSDSSDRMMLGFRGQLSELELDTSIDRMVKARWNKARRGEFLFIPPAGYELNETQEILFSKDEAVVETIAMVFKKFDELKAARQVWHWFANNEMKIPVKKHFKRYHPIQWCDVDYGKILRILKNPIYSGAYVFGQTKSEKVIDPDNPSFLKTRIIKQAQWEVLIKEHHPGYISFEQFEENQQILRGNQVMINGTEKAGSAREGEALLQGIARCGHCGRAMTISYGGHKSETLSRVYQYRCFAARSRFGGSDCQVIGGKRIDKIVVKSFFELVQPKSCEIIETLNHHIEERARQEQHYWQLQIEKAEYEVLRCQRQYEAVDPENRLVARTLEKNWEEKLNELEQTKVKAEKYAIVDVPLEKHEIESMQVIGVDLKKLWESKDTTNRDKKMLLRCLIDEVQLSTNKNEHTIKIIWKGGKITQEVMPRLKGGQVTATSDSDIELVRKLAIDFEDDQIARILNRQGRKSGMGNPYTKSSIVSLRGKQKIPKCKKRIKQTANGPFTLDETAKELGISMSTAQVWLKDGLIYGEQITPGAPWKIYLDEHTRKKLTGGEAPTAWVGLTEAARVLGLSKSRVSYLVKCAKIEAIRTTDGKRTCWKINVKTCSYGRQPELFEQIGN